MELTNNNSTSLNKYISATGICSRRDADEYISKGFVKINGIVAKKGNRVASGDKVTLRGKALKSKPKTIYIAYNKPVGIVCTTDLKERYNIIKAIGHKERLFPIGRLDKPSEGLIFLTNDGDIVNKILRAGNKHEKEYLVSVDKVVTKKFLLRMSSGVPILRTRTKKCKLQIVNKYSFRIILTQGLNRQIRRMCKHFGYEVIKLKRIRIMNIKLDQLGTGKWRNFTPKELNTIFKLTESSSKLQ